MRFERSAAALAALLVCLSPLASTSCAPPPPRRPLAAAPQASPPPRSDADLALGAAIDAYASSFGRHWGDLYAFSGYLAVAREGKIVFERGYGKADRERGVGADADTRFRIGSLTKQFTAVAVMQLVERGAVKVEDAIGKYVPGLSAETAAVTLHQLLTHTAGIANYTEDEALMKERARPHPAAEVVASFKDKPLAFRPGEKFAYSNSNYFLLGLVIERASGKSYEAFVQENLFRPAGMARTSTVDAPDAPNTAVGYTEGAAEALEPAGPVDMSLPFAAGALRSTARDLIAWDRALAGGRLLSAESKRRLVTPAKEDYAYGVGISREDGHDVQSHSGRIDGFVAFFARVPDMGLTVLALSNNEHFPAVRVGMPALKMAISGAPISPLEELAVAPMDEDLAARLFGEYALSDASRAALQEEGLPPDAIAGLAGLAVTREQGRMFVKATSRPRHEIFKSPDGELFTKSGNIRLEIELESGAPAASAVTTIQGGSKLRFTRDVAHAARAVPAKHGEK